MSGAEASASDPRAFLQERVALYLKFLLILIGSFYLLDAASAGIERGLASLFEAGLVLHLVLALGLLAVWLAVRRGVLPESISGAIEAASTIGVCAMAVAILGTLPASSVSAGPAFAVSLTLVARAAIVPSSGLRTLAIGIGAALILGYGYFGRGAESQLSADFVATWIFAFALASAGVSRVIYGLQKKVLEARQLGQYVLEEKLGEGGMGVVYRAHHAMLRRATAVKLLLPERTGVESLARFEREVRQTARLSHPNTITIFDYGRTPDGTFYYAMELLEGADLDEIVAVAGPLAPERVAHVLSRVAEALTEAHDSGLIHRDIKPANIFLCRQGGIWDVPKVLDFGLVKQLDSTGDLLKTQANAIVGTPHYMSPEAIKTPDEIDARSDIYALGAVGYYLLTGEQVFDGDTVVGVCLQHLDAAPVPPSERAGR